MKQTLSATRTMDLTLSSDRPAHGSPRRTLPRSRTDIQVGGWERREAFGVRRIAPLCSTTAILRLVVSK